MSQIDKLAVASDTPAPEPGHRDPAPPTTRSDLIARAPYALGYIVRRPGLALALAWIIALGLAAFAPGVFTSVNPLAPDGAVLSAPSNHHLFGTDAIGRDLFTRVVHGSSLSMRASVIAVGVGLAIGAPLGLLAGYAGGWVDTLFMRLVDVMLSIPSLLLALALIISFGFGLTNLALAVGVAFVGSSARVMRGEVLKIRQSPFIEAARAGGARRLRVLRRHVLPNSVEPVLVLAAMQFGEAILAISSLSFLGYGVQPPAPEWGALVSDGRGYLDSAWWLTTLPGLVIVATVLAANRISRALRRVDS